VGSCLGVGELRRGRTDRLLVARTPYRLD
jgi:hypothetical protein